MAALDVRVRQGTVEEHVPSSTIRFTIDLDALLPHTEEPPSGGSRNNAQRVNFASTSASASIQSVVDLLPYIGLYEGAAVLLSRAGAPLCLHGVLRGKLETELEVEFELCPGTLRASRTKTQVVAGGGAKSKEEAGKMVSEQATHPGA